MTNHDRTIARIQDADHVDVSMTAHQSCSTCQAFCWTLSVVLYGTFGEERYHSHVHRRDHLEQGAALEAAGRFLLMHGSAIARLDREAWMREHQQTLPGL